MSFNEHLALDKADVRTARVTARANVSSSTKREQLMPSGLELVGAFRFCAPGAKRSDSVFLISTSSAAVVASGAEVSAALETSWPRVS